MTIIRIKAAGPAVLVAMMLASAPTHACDDRYPLTCLPRVSPVPATETSPDQATTTAKPQTTESGRTYRRRSAAKAETHPRKKDAAARRDARPTTPVAPSPAPQPRQEASTDDDFKELVNPWPIAVNPNEALRTPQTDSSQLARATTFPVGALPATGSADTVAGNEIELEAARMAARDQVTEAAAAARPTPAATSDKRSDGTADTASTVAQAGAIESRRAAPPDRAPFNRPWLEIIFIAWGTLLTVGSALRLLIG